MATFSTRVTAGADDGYGNLDGSGTWKNTFNFLGFGNYFPVSVVLCRFQNVTIPQGSIINSAKITFYFSGGSANGANTNIYGIDEDNTASFSSDPRSRTKTTAVVTWDFSAPSLNSSFDTSDISSVIKEIVDRGGWSSGNALGIRIEDDGSTFGQDADSYEKNTLTCALLTVDYTVVSPSSSPSASPSPSSSQSPSSSPSASPSATPSESSSPSRSPSQTPSPSPSLSPSLSPSASESRSPSLSPSASPSPSPEPLEFFGLKVAKDNENALETDEPEDFKFHSDYGTLKYFTKQEINLEIDANNGDIGCKGSYEHNLGYYPFVEVFVRVYIGTPSDGYQYCPFAGAGATVLYDANFIITESKIEVYGQINGVSSSTWSFDFLIFVYKNDLQLST